MYQISAAYKAVTTEARQLNVIQRFFGVAEKETTIKVGSVQFTADTLTEGMSKLQYLIKDISTVEEMSIQKI